MANYWLLSAGKDGELWPTFWNEKVIAIGWSALGDLRQYPDRESLKAAYQAAYPSEKPRQVGNAVGEIWRFYLELHPGELVFVRSYGANIGIAEVKSDSDYEFLPPSDPLRKKLRSAFFRDDFPNIRRVRWLSLWGGLKQSRAFTRLTLMP